MFILRLTDKRDSVHYLGKREMASRVLFNETVVVSLCSVSGPRHTWKLRQSDTNSDAAVMIFIVLFLRRDEVETSETSV